MFDFLTVIEDINKAIFQPNKAERPRQNLSTTPPLKDPPLKDPPEINPKNDFSVFFFTIFNLCSGGERRDCVRKNTNNNQTKNIGDKTPQLIKKTTTTEPDPKSQEERCEEEYYRLIWGGKHLGYIYLHKSEFEKPKDEFKGLEYFKIQSCSKVDAKPSSVIIKQNVFESNFLPLLPNKNR